MESRRCGQALGLKISEPAQGTQAWKEAILTTARNHELRQAFESHSDWPSRDVECSIAIARAGNWIRPRGSPEESTIVHPLGLHKLELPAQIGSNKREHQSTVHAVVFKDALRHVGSIGSSAPDHSVNASDARNLCVARVCAADVRSTRGLVANRVVFLEEEVVVALAVRSERGIVMHGT